MQQNKILAEMTAHIPLCTHYEAKEVFVFGTVGIELKNELEKYKKESNIVFFDILKKDLTLLGNNFWIAMPYSFSHSTMILGSKKYHPTADLNLHRADFLENMEYYSSDIHLATFVFPAKIHKELTGFAKR